jgi:hypothetical protein
MKTPIIALLQFCLPAEFWWYAYVLSVTPKLTGSSAFKFRYNTAPPLEDSSCCETA